MRLDSTLLIRFYRVQERGAHPLDDHQRYRAEYRFG